MSTFLSRDQKSCYANTGSNQVLLFLPDGSKVSTLFAKNVQNDCSIFSNLPVVPSDTAEIPYLTHVA